MKKLTHFLALISILLTTSSLNAQDRTIEPGVDKFGSAIILERNSTNGTIERISNLGLNISQYGYELSSLNVDQVKALATQVIADYGDFVGLAAQDFSRQRVVQRDGRWHVYARQQYRGVPVLGTDFGFSIGTRGRITALRTRVFPKLSLGSVTPAIDAQTASTIALAAFERELGVSGGRVKNNVYLAVRPHLDDKAGASDLVWVVDVVSSSPWVDWEFWVDAVKGQLIQSHNLIRSGTITVDVKKYVWPLHPNDPIEPGGGGIPGVAVTVAGYQNQQTNENGRWTGSATGGPFNMWLYKSPLTLTKSGVVNILNAETYDENVTVQVDVLKEVPVARDETNVYYHVDQMHSYFQYAPYFYSDMNYTMDASVHCGPTVDGGSDGITIGFGTAYGGNWARAADVIYHEYTHNVIAHIYREEEWDPPQFIDLSPFESGEDAAMDEGFADYFASVKTSDPVHGEDVLDGDPYVRHLDYSYTKDGWGIYPLDEYHRQGQIISGACWDVRQALLNIPNFNPDLLVFNALFYHTRNFSDFANALADADDDDNNESNGTPHLSTIRDKFYARKIYFTYGPPQAPQSVSVSGSPGQHPIISWAANHESDLSGYKVYRKMPPYEADFHLIATVSSSTTSYADTYIYVNSGTGDPTAYYYVVAYDASSYLSDASNIVSTRVHPPGWPKISPALPERPTAHQLFDAYPNPFNPSTTIRYALADDAHISVSVCNIQGKELAILTNGMRKAGYYETRFTGENLASGVYFVRMSVHDALGKESYRRVTKLLLTK